MGPHLRGAVKSYFHSYIDLPSYSIPAYVKQKPLGENRTFAQMEREEKNKLSHRFKAFREFKAYVKQSTGL